MSGAGDLEADRQQHGEAPLLSALSRPRAYPHPVQRVRRVETHMSWIFLTGDYAYKVKKPIHFAFADFSTLERRQYFCEEELRCNQRFAAELYLAVVPIVRDPAGVCRVLDERNLDLAGATVVEWAVRMRQFDTSAQADVLLENGELTVAELRHFGLSLAALHAELPRISGTYDPLTPVADNFSALASAVADPDLRRRAQALAAEAVQESAALAPTLLARQGLGRVRDCHGDLYLSNMVRLNGELKAFDCLEFDAALRGIDLLNDAAFLVMDCLVRERADLAYAFLDGYLDRSGDYAGALLLPYFARYRSMVRAKVAALRLLQAPDDRGAGHKLENHLAWAERQQRRGPGQLVLMNGVSGTGKSYWAAQLVPALGALRLRSDVLRKAEFAAVAESPERSQTEPSSTAVQGGLYQASVSQQVYARLAELSEALLRAGETVIVDATCLGRAERAQLLAAARRAGSRSLIVRLTAPDALLRSRIAERQRAGGDPSDADETVLDWQLSQEERPDPASEPVLVVDTTSLTLADLCQRVLDAA